MILRKILLTGSILALSSSVALAATPYVGGSLGYSGFKHQSGEIVNVFGGYGDTLGQSQIAYLGGELGLNVAHYTKYSTMYGVNASLLPGIMLSKSTMVYGRVGLDQIYAPHKVNTNKYIFGTQYGLGVQTNVSDNWDVRGEYVYSNARKDGQYNLGLVYKFS
jgi:opacity protein-like surface antigen